MKVWYVHVLLIQSVCAATYIDITVVTWQQRKSCLTAWCHTAMLATFAASGDTEVYMIWKALTCLWSRVEQLESSWKWKWLDCKCCGIQYPQFWHLYQCLNSNLNLHLKAPTHHSFGLPFPDCITPDRSWPGQPNSQQAICEISLADSKLVNQSIGSQPTTWAEDSLAGQLPIHMANWPAR